MIPVISKNAFAPERHENRTDRDVPHFVYILRCADTHLYVGYTTAVDSRVFRHNEGLGGRFTARRRPVELLYTESHETLAGALKRERQLKHWTKVKKLALAAGNAKALKASARRRRR